MRDAFARTTTAILDEDPRTALVLAVISRDLFTGAAARHPDRVVDVGIREQLMVGVAGGLALSGLRPIVHIAEMGFYSERPLVYLIVGGVFERFPKLKFVLTEAGCAWIPAALKHLDFVMSTLRGGKTGEMRFDGETVPPRSATEYFEQNFESGLDALLTGFEHKRRAASASGHPHVG